MTKEYHVLTNIQKDHQQAFVFEVERGQDPNYISLEELWLVTVQNGGEVKSRINLRDMIRAIGHNIGGNVEDKNVPEITEVFKEVLGDEKRLEVQINLCEKEIENLSDESDKLLKAADYADILSKENSSSVQKLIDKILLKKQNQ
jgi:hypothetical protein